MRATASRHMRISVAMATYNGEKYLREQLESFALQTRLPDELVVVDDGSNDGTVDIVREFSASVPFQVRLHQNPVNSGYVGSFGRAIALCTGTLILLSDQDDVWFHHKISTVAKCFQDSPELLVLINDQLITNEQLKSSGRTKLAQFASARFSTDLFVTGCCTSFRSEIKAAILPIPDSGIPHDNWIHLVARHIGSRKVLPEVLQLYRRHETNASSAVISSTERISRLAILRSDLPRLKADTDGYLESQRAEAELLVDALTRYHLSRESEFSRASLDQRLAPILRSSEIAGKRLALRRKSRLRRWEAFRLWLAGDYKLYRRWRTLLRDLFL